MRPDNLLKPYSIIYVEEDLREDPATGSILSKFPSAKVVHIKSYSEIFNRKAQDFRLQKMSSKLILARKKDNFLYDGSAYAQNFGEENFFYTTPVLNCLYDCEYCFLQGMFDSAHTVIFLNSSDFQQNIKDKLGNLSSLYLAISYETDLLALENIYPWCQRFYKLCAQHPNLKIECRTKSVNYKSFLKLAPLENFIFAWTLTPDIIQQNFEKGTPSLAARIKAVNAVLQTGFPVRICLDPIIRVKNWQNVYQEFIGEISGQIAFDKVRDFALGSFRMNKNYFKKISKDNPSSWIYNYPYEVQADMISYKNEHSLELNSHLLSLLKAQNIPDGKIVAF